MVLPYTIIFFIVLFILLEKSKNGKACLYAKDTRFDKQCLLLFFFVFYVLFAFRSQEVGNDTVAYIELYSKFEQTSYSKLLAIYYGRFEIGFLLYCKLLSLIWACPQFLFIVSGIIILTSFYRLIIKYSNFILLSVFLFFTLRLFDDSLNVLRQVIAVCFVICSYAFLRKQKIVPFVFWVLVAFLFHKSAIIFLLAWFIIRVKINKGLIYTWAVVLLTVAVVAPFIISLLFSNNIIPAYYLNSEYLNSGKIAPILLLLISLVICLFGLYSKVYQIPHDEQAKGKAIFDNKNMLILQMFACILLVFNIYFAVILRVAAYFQVFSIILLPNALRSIKNRHTYLIFLTLIIVVFMLYFVITITFRPEWNRVYPYSFSGNLIHCT